MGHELRARLGTEVLRTSWADLAPHHARGALLLAAGELDLLEVGVAIASDDASAVEAWLREGRLRRATDPECAAWAEAPPAFQVLILQPFVLAQPLP